MKKVNCWKLAGILIMVCILAGCNMQPAGTETMESDMPAKETELNVGAANAEIISDSGKLSDSSARELPEAAELNEDLFNGSDMDLWIGENETLIALKEDTLYLYDIAEGEIIAEGKTEHWFMVNIYPCNGGFCMIGNFQDDVQTNATPDDEQFIVEIEDDMTTLAVFYDSSLQEKSRFVLNDIVEYPDATVWTVSPDASMLAYFNLWDGLCLYDCNDKSRKQLLDFSGSREKVLNLLAIDILFFDGENERLVFTGGTDKGNITFESWGCINLDGTGFENHICEKDAGTAVAYKTGRLLLGEDSLTFEKKMGYVDTVTKKEKYSTDIEGGYTIGGPVFSDLGETFAVTDIEGSQAVLTIYNTADFSKIYQEVITDENEELFYHLPRVYLFDRLRVGLICMGGYDIPLKTFLIRY